MSDETRHDNDTPELDSNELENIAGGASAGVRPQKAGIKSETPQAAMTGGIMAEDDWESPSS